MLQCTLKNYALWNFFSKCVKFGTRSTPFKKKNSKCFNIRHINAHWKKSKIKFCIKISNTIINFEHESITTNILSTILLIVRSFVNVLKILLGYKCCASCKLKHFCIDSVSVFLTHLPLLDIFRHFSKIKVLFLLYFLKRKSLVFL